MDIESGLQVGKAERENRIRVILELFPLWDRAT